MERTMQFIVEQQAQFVANVKKLEEVQVRDAPRLVRVETAFVELVELVRRMDERIDTQAIDQAKTANGLERNETHLALLTEQVTKLADAQVAANGRLDTISGALAATDERLATLAQLQANTDRQLARLATTVERIVSNKAPIEADPDTPPN
jgi:chromosome segregation ATPase